MSKTNPKVEWYFAKGKKWQEEFVALRTIALGCGLDEELKWGHPCYMLNGSNVVLMHGFKDYCAYLFFKGALLKDPKGILVQQTANVQAARQVRFTSLSEIIKLKATLKAYIKEAMQVEKKGLKVEYKKIKDFKIPEEFQTKLEESPALKKAFYALTPGRQRGYIFYFSQAKQSQTREARVEKYMEQILKGKGLDD
ncbi:MAG: YdeI family protein [Cytophagaceae bacterium]|nr:YdeI family protein [Cytophagaceae bacterium]